MATHQSALDEKARLMSGGFRCIVLLDRPTMDGTSGAAGANRVRVRDLRRPRHNEAYEHECQHLIHAATTQSGGVDWKPPPGNRGNPIGALLGVLSGQPNSVAEGKTIPGTYCRMRASEAGNTFRSDVVLGDPVGKGVSGV